VGRGRRRSGEERQVGVATALGRTEGGGGWGIRKWEAKAKGAADSGDSGRQWRGGERRRQERQAARG
jgi:hypothetical protein